ncbi:MAG: hypothetical protein K6C96_04080 [Butyrivibrio sp.]|nr:hypothetical protein [Butyrivibrio sp.]
MTVVIRAQLSLALRLVDTTTGREVEERGTSFFLNGNRLQPMYKGPGIFVFVNIGREDFLMQIDAPGYDKTDVKVNYEELDPRLPMLDVFLMPSEKNRIGGSVLEISGTLSELQYIEAINLDRPIGLFHSITEKKNVSRMTLLPMRPGGGCRLDSIRYALLSETGERYDCFEVKEQDAPLSIVLKDSFETEHKLNDKIYRIIYGRAGPDGAFSLKVRDDSDHLPYLIHFKVGEDEYFKTADFHLDAGHMDLLKDAAKVIPITEENSEDSET